MTDETCKRLLAFVGRLMSALDPPPVFILNDAERLTSGRISLWVGMSDAALEAWDFFGVEIDEALAIVALNAETKGGPGAYFRTLVPRGDA